MAEIRVLSVNGVKLALPELAREFERQSGHKLAVSLDEAGHLRGRIVGGEAFDIAILPRAAAAALAAQGKLAGGEPVDLVRAEFGLGARAGMPPQSASLDDFRRFLLGARTIAYTDPATGGVSGVFFARMADELGIGEAVAARGRLTAGVLNDELVARGEAEIAVQMKHELLAVPGIDFVPFPPPYCDTGFVVFSAGPGPAARPEAAALIRFLRGPTAASLFRTKGLDPI